MRRSRSSLDANGLRAQRGQIRTRAGLAEQLAPDEFAAQRGGYELLDLLGGAVLEDGGHRPPSDHQIGPNHVGLGQLLVDQQLLGRAGLAAVRPWPVRCEQPGVGQRHLPLLVGLRGDFGYRRGDLGPQMLDRFEIDVAGRGARPAG